MLQKREELPSHPHTLPTVWPFSGRGGYSHCGHSNMGVQSSAHRAGEGWGCPQGCPSPPSLPGWVWGPPLQCCPGLCSPSLQLLVSAPHAPAQLAPPKSCQEPGLSPSSVRVAQLLQMEGRSPKEAPRPLARRLHPPAAEEAQHSKPAVTRTSAHENGLGWGWGMGSALSLQGLRTGAIRPHLGSSQLAWSFRLIYSVFKSI